MVGLFSGTAGLNGGNGEFLIGEVIIPLRRIMIGVVFDFQVEHGPVLAEHGAVKVRFTTLVSEIFNGFGIILKIEVRYVDVVISVGDFLGGYFNGAVHVECGCFGLCLHLYSG